MREEERSFVLVVEGDRVVATTLATVLHSGGYLAATTASSDATLRIASRMVVDAAVIDVDTNRENKAVNRENNLETAVALQEKYPHCRILLVCGQAQAQDVGFLAEENGLDCEIVVRPLRRSDLLDKLASRGLQRASSRSLSERHLKTA